MDRLLVEFRRAQRRRNLSVHTIASRNQRLWAFRQWLDSRGKGLLDATPEDVDAWLDGLEPTPGTRSTYMGHLAAFYRWAVRDELMPSSPLDRMDRPKRPDRLPRPMDVDELAIALDEADDRMRAWLLLGGLQGLRCSSMARLRVEGVDRHTMTLRVWSKGNREHCMALHPDVLAALDRYGMPASSWVFRNQVHGYEHERLADSTVSCYINRFLRRLGSDAVAHQLRHLFCTLVVRKTRDITVAADLAGHRSIATTRDYAKVAADTTRSALTSLTLA